eukprot:g11625.t1
MSSDDSASPTTAASETASAGGGTSSPKGQSSTSSSTSPTEATSSSSSSSSTSSTTTSTSSSFSSSSSSSSSPASSDAASSTTTKTTATTSPPPPLPSSKSSSSPRSSSSSPPPSSSSSSSSSSSTASTATSNSTASTPKSATANAGTSAASSTTTRNSNSHHSNSSSSTTKRTSSTSSESMQVSPAESVKPEVTSEDASTSVTVAKSEPESEAKDDGQLEATQQEIFSYEAPWLVYGLNWSVRKDKPFRLAVGSFIEDYNNKVNLIELNNEKGRLEVTGSFDHPYPTTKIMFNPDLSSDAEDIVATTGDYLRLWKIKPDGKVKMAALLNNNKNSEFCAPLTSFDWNETDPSIVGTCSIDTTCTIWNVETHQPTTQLIAHDKEVYDIAFAPSTDVFASVGADGSVRMFDLRNLEHSTIIYESPQFVPLLRLCWNKHDHNYLATFLMEQSYVVILDIRAPSVPVAQLHSHTQPVNTLAWAPHSSCHICTGGDDAQALIWDLSAMPKPITEPILAYTAEAEVNTLQWSSTQPEWVAIAFEKKVQILRVPQLALVFSLPLSGTWKHVISPDWSLLTGNQHVIIRLNASLRLLQMHQSS